MDWHNERYVRVYTRDTTELVVIPWLARLTFWELLRKCDRAGVLDLGDDGSDGLAALLRVPPDAASDALAEWVKRGMVELRDGVVVVPNFIAAQESGASGAQRTRRHRERKRDLARGGPCNESLQDVTDVTPSVTGGMDRVRPCNPLPCRSVPPVPPVPCQAEGRADTHAHPRKAPSDCDSPGRSDDPLSGLDPDAPEPEPCPLLAMLEDSPAVRAAGMVPQRAADAIMGRVLASGRSLELAAEALADAIADADGAVGSRDELSASQLSTKFRRFTDNARRPPPKPEPIPGLDCPPLPATGSGSGLPPATPSEHCRGARKCLAALTASNFEATH